MAYKRLLFGLMGFMALLRRSCVNFSGQEHHFKCLSLKKMSATYMEPVEHLQKLELHGALGVASRSHLLPYLTPTANELRSTSWLSLLMQGFIPQEAKALLD